MFNMVYTGARLAEARKAKDMTQLELADKLGISFQAVSNWERGNSMPDISKLPEISQLLGISTDELLGKEAPLINSIIENKSGEYLANNDVTVADAAEAAPLLKPSQTDEIAGSISKKHKLSELEDLLPFLSKSICNELFAKAVADGDYSGFAELAPFVDCKTVSKYALKIYREKGFNRCFDDLAPFIDGETLAIIADEEYARSGLRNFENIAPFMSGNKLRELAKSAIEKDGIKAIAPIAPFLGSNFLSSYVRERFL